MSKEGRQEGKGEGRQEGRKKERKARVQMDWNAWKWLEGSSAGRERCKNAKLVARGFQDNIHQRDCLEKL